MADCRNCEFSGRPSYEWPCNICADSSAFKQKPKPTTNADRIRSMSDEELANELGFVAQDAFMYGCGERERMMLYPFENYKSTIDWLQSPVGGGGDG